MNLIENDEWNMECINEFCKDNMIDPNSVSSWRFATIIAKPLNLKINLLLLAWKLNAKTMGNFTRSEWLTLAESKFVFTLNLYPANDCHKM